MPQTFAVEFKVEVPDDVDPRAAMEWIAYEVNATDSLKFNNPMGTVELEPVRGSFLVRRHAA
jgi:hypothetical protein